MELLLFVGDLFWGLVGLFRKSTAPRATPYQVTGVVLLAGCIGAWATALCGPEEWQVGLLVIGALLLPAAIFCGYMRLGDGDSSKRQKGKS
jgi:hypothetical protein